MTRPTDSPKYGVTRKNIPRYYTLNRLIRYIYFIHCFDIGYPHKIRNVFKNLCSHDFRAQNFAFHHVIRLYFYHKLPCTNQNACFTLSTSCPGPSPCLKWRSEKPLAKAAEILQESWSILSRDTWWNGFFGGCFQRLGALFVFCNRKPLFKRNEDISACLRDKILTNFWSHFGSLGQGFLRPPFWTRRRPWGRGCYPVYCIIVHNHKETVGFLGAIP